MRTRLYRCHRATIRAGLRRRAQGEGAGAVAVIAKVGEVVQRIAPRRLRLHRIELRVVPVNTIAAERHIPRLHVLTLLKKDSDRGKRGRGCDLTFLARRSPRFCATSPAHITCDDSCLHNLSMHTAVQGRRKRKTGCGA